MVLANLLGTAKTFKDVKIPDLVDVNAQAEQQKAIAGNIAALPGATELAGGINKFNFDQLQTMLKAAIPNYDEIMQTGGKQLSSFLRGELPADVQRTIQRSQGAKAFAGGYGGSGFAGAGEAEKLGLQSLDLIREGLSSSERWFQAASSRLPQLANASSMFISPAQQIANTRENVTNRFNYDFLKAKQAAMPKGWEIAVNGLTDWLENIGASAATMGIGGAMGSGGGGSGGGMGGLSSMFGGGGGSKPANLSGGSNFDTGFYPGEVNNWQ